MNGTFPDDKTAKLIKRVTMDKFSKLVKTDLNPKTQQFLAPLAPPMGLLTCPATPQPGYQPQNNPFLPPSNFVGIAQATLSNPSAHQRIKYDVDTEIQSSKIESAVKEDNKSIENISDLATVDRPTGT